MPHAAGSVPIMHEKVDHSNVFLQATGGREGPHKEYGSVEIPHSSFPINPVYEGDPLLTLKCAIPHLPRCTSGQELGSMDNTLCRNFCCLAG